MCVCVCVCVRARARARVCVWSVPLSFSTNVLLYVGLCFCLILFLHSPVFNLMTIPNISERVPFFSCLQFKGWRSPNAITALLSSLRTSLYPSRAMHFPAFTAATGSSPVHVAVVLKGDLATVHSVKLTVAPVQSVESFESLRAVRTCPQYGNESL